MPLRHNTRGRRELSTGYQHRERNDRNPSTVQCTLSANWPVHDRSCLQALPHRAHPAIQDSGTIQIGCPPSLEGNGPQIAGQRIPGKTWTSNVSCTPACEFEQGDDSPAGQIHDSEPRRELIAAFGQGHALEAPARTGPRQAYQCVASREGQAAGITGQFGHCLGATRAGIDGHQPAPAGIEQPDCSPGGLWANEARQSPARPSCSWPRRSGNPRWICALSSRPACRSHPGP